MTHGEIKIYLDECITAWRSVREHTTGHEAGDKDALRTARCYIDAFQSVRMTIFDELLP